MSETKTQIVVVANRKNLADDTGKRCREKIAEMESARKSAVIAAYEAGEMLAKERAKRKADHSWSGWQQANGINRGQAALCIAFYERARKAGGKKIIQGLALPAARKQLGLTRSQRDEAAKKKGKTRPRQTEIDLDPVEMLATAHERIVSARATIAHGTASTNVGEVTRLSQLIAKEIYRLQAALGIDDDDDTPVVATKKHAHAAAA